MFVSEILSSSWGEGDSQENNTHLNDKTHCNKAGPFRQCKAMNHNKTGAQTNKFFDEDKKVGEKASY